MEEVGDALSDNGGTSQANANFWQLCHRSFITKHSQFSSIPLYVGTLQGLLHLIHDIHWSQLHFNRKDGSCLPEQVDDEHIKTHLHLGWKQVPPKNVSDLLVRDNNQSTEGLYVKDSLCRGTYV